MTEWTEQDKHDSWPCACVKRDRAGKLKAIKLNLRSVAKCRKCGATREEADRLSDRQMTER